MSVFVTSYEVNEVGLPIIAQFNQSLADWHDKAWAITGELGGKGFQPGWSGIRAILFQGECPSGWRVIERDPEPGHIRCAPRKTSKAGKAIADLLSGIGSRPRGEEAASLFGWAPPEMAIDGSRIFFPTAQTIELPSPRHFIRLPRFPGDNWNEHPGLSEVPESEYMRAIEAHNAEVKKLTAASEPTARLPATTAHEAGGVATGELSE